MSEIDAIKAQPFGAQFRRADLHIHSFGAGMGSYDVADATATPAAIVDTAIVEGLSVISITDHNMIGNSIEAVQYASGKAVLVVPGVELTTPQGHLLVYLPSTDALERFVGKLSLSDDRKQCGETIVQSLGLAKQFGGFGIAAHIDLDSGFETLMNGYPPFKTDILKSDNLLGLEVSQIANEAWFTDRDASADRKRLLNLRIAELKQGDDHELARIQSSDAHTLAALGKNAAGSRRLTRLKMDSLSFDALRIALQDAGARVRLEDLIPTQIPRFVGVKLNGGFVRDQVVAFSRNLTCIIGGRGAGKSTLLEAVRAGSGNACREALLDSEVWPDRITLVYEDETGRQQTLVKDRGTEVVNATHPDDGVTRVSIESYGQGATAEAIQHCKTDPKSLQDFLDTFLDLATVRAADRAARDELLANQTEIERLELQVAQIPAIQQAKNIAEAQVKTLKESNAQQVIDLEQRLAREKVLKDELNTGLREMLVGIRESLAERTVIDRVLAIDGSDLVVGKDEFQKVRTLVESISTRLDSVAATMTKEMNATVGEIGRLVDSWNRKEADTRTQIENLRKTLETQGVRLDIKFIQKVAKDVNDHTLKLQQLGEMQKKLVQARAQRNRLLVKRRELATDRYTRRRALADRLNENLRETVTDFRVTVKYHEGLFSDEFAQLVTNAMGWRTSRVPKAKLIADSVGPLKVLDVIKTRDTSALEAIELDGQRVFSKAEAVSILDTLGAVPVLRLIERCQFEDRPQIVVSRPSGSGAAARPITRDFSQLSLGQQQAILLSILLFSDSNQPLVIDQPEDNLDGEFVFKTLVKALRRVKERRQVIIVTHNANIAVLGDAELILPLKSSNERAMILERGSIDAAGTKAMACTILEGSELAFKRRKLLYGID